MKHRFLVYCALQLALAWGIWQWFSADRPAAALPVPAQSEAAKPSGIRRAAASGQLRPDADVVVGRRQPAALAVDGPDQPPAPAAAPDERVPDEYVFRFFTADARRAFEQRATTAGARVLGRLDRFNAVRLAIGPGALTQLLQDGAAEYEPNYYVRTPDHPAPDALLDTAGNLAFGGQALRWLGLDEPQATWGAGILVAILDTGITSHPALAETKLTHIDIVVPTAPDEAPAYLGHGTAVAGILAGNGAPVQGVAPAVELLDVRVLAADGTGNTFDVAAGILAAVDAGAEIINLSLGSYANSAIMQDAVAYAVENGVVLVAAAGNDGQSNLTYPAQYETVIAVGAVDASGLAMSFVNSGEAMDVTAPGWKIDAAWVDEQIVAFSGTSAATPFVAGAVAAAMSTSSQLTAMEAAAIVLDNTDDAGLPWGDPYYGQGTLNLDRVAGYDQPGRYDVGVMTPYVDTSTMTDETVALMISAQNRGTEALASVQLRIEVAGHVYDERFSNVAVAETVTRTMQLRQSLFDDNATVRMIVEARIDGRQDINPDDNRRSAVIMRESLPSQ